MKGLDVEHSKIKKICTVLKKETLEPAQLEAEAILSEAKEKAGALIQEAAHQIEKMHRDARNEIQKQKIAFEASLSQACRQTIEALKEKIESRFFSPELASLLHEPLTSSTVIAKLITATVSAIEKEGVDTDFTALIPQCVSKEEVNHLLGQAILEKLKGKSVAIGTLTAGAEVKLTEQKITLDLSLETFQEMIANYIRKDFRRLFFGLS